MQILPRDYNPTRGLLYAQDLLEPLDESSLLGDHMNQLAWSHLDQLQAIGRSQESHIGDMQILFQANR